MAPKRPQKEAASKIAAKTQATKAEPSRSQPNIAAPESWQRGQRSSEQHGTLVSHTNPRYFPVTSKADTPRKNDNFETMPTPEVWHSQMSGRFPFGETPYMERCLSNQINKDLGMKDKIQELPTSLPFEQLSHGEKVRIDDPLHAYEPEDKKKSMWALPEVTDEAVVSAIDVLSRGKKRAARSVPQSGSRQSKRVKGAQTAEATI